MDINFQDRIDQYLLHPDTMSEEEKAQFLKEVEEDAEKKRQFELTVNLKAAIKSREEKLQAIRMMQRQHDWKRKASGRNKWVYWLSGVAAVVAIGFFVIRPVVYDDAIYENSSTISSNRPTYPDGAEERIDYLCDSCACAPLPNDTLSDDTLSSEFIVDPSLYNILH